MFIPQLIRGRAGRGIYRPDGALGIDINHPAAAGLISCWVPIAGGIVRDIVGGGPHPATNGNPVWGVGRQGTEARDSTGGNNFSISSPSSAQKPTIALSFLYLGRFQNSSGGGNSPRTFACEANNANASPFISWGMYQTSTTAINIAYNNGSLQTLSGITYSLNVPICVVVTLVMGGAIQAWVGGKLLASGTAASGTITYGVTAVVDWGHITGAANTIYSGFGFSLSALWNYALPSRLAQILSSDPSQFLIFPEDCVSATLRGAAAAPAFLPFDRPHLQIWQ